MRKKSILILVLFLLKSFNAFNKNESECQKKAFKRLKGDKFREKEKRERFSFCQFVLSLQWMIKQKNKSHSSSELLHKSFLYESFHSPLSDPSQTFPLFFSPFLSLKKEERCSLFPVPLPSLAPLFPFQDPRSSFLDSLFFLFFFFEIPLNICCQTKGKMGPGRKERK